MKVRRKKSVRGTLSVGSALILAVVLTSLLAIVGVMFVMASRVDRIATSAISENKELNLAVDTVVAKISQELVLDTPGSPDLKGLEYYDYPDLSNSWLASLEPNESGIWRQISNLTGAGVSWRNLQPEIIADYQDSSAVDVNLPADADGDGVADSLWIALDDMTSGKGKPIFAAIRVIDNGGMLNVNTGFKFDPYDPMVTAADVDGSSQMQINLAGLSQRGANGTLAEAADKLQTWRRGAELPDLALYQQNVIWRCGSPIGAYTLFDIGDELKLRNRYIVNYNLMTSRIEKLWTKTYDWGPRVPIPGGTYDLGDWFYCANNSSSDPCEYDYRHISTTYNMDRIIRPDGGKMAGVNRDSVGLLYDAMRPWLYDAGVPDPNGTAAQIAVNIADYRDDNNDVNTIRIQVGASTYNYYGFERPCIYISELVCKSVIGAPDMRSYAVELCNPHDEKPPVGWQLVIGGYPASPIDIDWTGTRRFHVIRWEDPNVPLWVSWTDPNGPNPSDGAKGADPNVVLSWPAEGWAASYDVYFGTDFDDVNAGSGGTSKGNRVANTYDPGTLEFEKTYYWRIDDVNGSTRPGEVWSFTTAGAGYKAPVEQDMLGVGPLPWLPGDTVFNIGSLIELRRLASDGNYVVVDSNRVPLRLVGGEGTRSHQRDITRHKCIRRLWADVVDPNSTLGHSNGFRHPDQIMIQAHPANRDFTNIGEIGMVFCRGAYYRSGEDPNALGRIGYSPASDTEDEVRINSVDPVFQQIFNYLTVFDPVTDYMDNDGDGLGVDMNGDGLLDSTEIDPNELKIAGRININTAPWYVIAQLPWMTPAIAQAIVAWRDTVGGFRSIGELNNVVNAADPASSIDYFWRVDNPLTLGDQLGFPDLTPNDKAPDDFEERDLIFARISNLVTVRSDVFTAYILVRIGADGPQKRVIAILDRSDVYPDGLGGVIGKVRVRALHPVPDPR